MAQEARAKLILVGLGIVILCLGLIFSLSRSGVTFALVGCAAFSLLAFSRAEPNGSALIELERSRHGRVHVSRDEKRRRSGHMYWALGLAVVAVAFWIGMDPLISRFELLPQQLESERGRTQVWTDSLGVVKDFWLTGTGLSSFAYVFPVYRSFGGEIFYSWAHNDYLQLLIELGAPGMILLIWTMAAVWRRAHRIRRELSDDPALLRLHAGYCAALIAIALHSTTDFGLHMPANAALLSVILGVVVGVAKPQDSTHQREGPRAAKTRPVQAVTG